MEGTDLPFEVQPEYLDQTMRKKYRFLCLFLTCCFVIGNYFCYDNPASLEIQIEEVFGITPQKYGLLYTGYAIPNMFMPIIGGLLYDRFGIRVCLMCFSITLTCG